MPLRVYLGVHYPSDVIGGALIGLGGTWLLLNVRIGSKLADIALRFERRWPSSFYALAFLLLAKCRHSADIFQFTAPDGRREDAK